MISYICSVNNVSTHVQSKADSECVNRSISAFPFQASLRRHVRKVFTSPGSVGPMDAPDGHAMHHEFTEYVYSKRIRSVANTLRPLFRRSGISMGKCEGRISQHSSTVSLSVVLNPPFLTSAPSFIIPYLY
jgi:hypothetical protein